METDPLAGVVAHHADVSTLNAELEALPAEATVVYTYGAWDLLHPGHVIFLARAAALGDFLVVGVVADAPIKGLKGEDRPLQTQAERIITAGALRCVDAIIGQPEYDPSPQLRSLSRVDILTKGDDWDYIPGTETIEELGGRLVQPTYTEAYSTSKLVAKMGDEDT